MNETEKDRILKMVSEGTLRPAEAAHLLAALAEEPSATVTQGVDTKAKPKQPMVEIQMQRADGSHYTVQVPPNLAPMLLQMAKVAIQESARNASQEVWAGLKNIVYNKTQELKSNVRTRLSGGATAAVPALSEQESLRSEARRKVLQMVQNGRISASDAGRLIQELDAHQAHQEKSLTYVRK